MQNVAKKEDPRVGGKHLGRCSAGGEPYQVRESGGHGTHHPRLRPSSEGITQYNEWRMQFDDVLSLRRGHLLEG